MINEVAEVEIQRVPDNLIREADNLSKETRISFRDCLDILMKAYLRGTDMPTERTEWDERPIVSERSY